MLLVATLMFAWLTASYLTPVSSATYEHAISFSPATAEQVIVAHSQDSSLEQ